MSAVGGLATEATGNTFTATASATLGGTYVKEIRGHLIHAPSEGANSTTNTLTEDIEAVQAKVNTARVQAGSQYAALESAVSFTTDLTAQYELGFNTVNDVNFSGDCTFSEEPDFTTSSNGNACSGQPGSARSTAADTELKHIV